jgi:phosphoribosyl-ATP pyrophosphohydrolase/phosphoribosyl-AMP cyclohydrolase
MNLDGIRFDAHGLVPAIVQDDSTGSVLTLAYMNREALEKTINTGVTWFYSRSRKQLWQKGETSGNSQQVKEIWHDCDSDAVLVKVQPSGPACHEGTYSCFSRRLGEEQTSLDRAFDPEQVYGGGSVANVLQDLYGVIKDRKENPKEGSYTCYLFTKGKDKILKKVGEESAETIIASKNDDKQEIVYEMADLWYHCLVLLAWHGITPAELTAELGSRRK